MTDFEALDRYLRHRYPPLQRLASVLAKSALPIGLMARRSVERDPADVLLLHPHPGAARRHEALAAALAERRMNVRHAVLPGAGDLLASRALHVPAEGWDRTPRAWRMQAGYAAWLCERHRPKVLATFMDDSTHSPFLRAALAAHGGLAVNIAHAMCWPSLDFSMCDFDWLLLWGRRSLDNLRAAPIRYGACRTLEIGSIYLQAPPAARTFDAQRVRVLWIGQDHRSAHRAALEHDALVFAGFAASHPRHEIAIRVHPLDRGELRRLLAPRIARARWIEATEPFSRALEAADIAVSSFSAGLVDAAARGLPVVAFSSSALAEAIGLEEHGLPVVADETGLAKAIDALVADYPGASQAASRLAAEHLFALDDATPRCATVLDALAKGRDPSTLGFPADRLEHKAA